MKTNILDCTLRDGGYYNNWLFSNKLINEYINFIERNQINFIEIGFRFFDEIRTKGNTAYSDLSFIKSLKFKIKHQLVSCLMVQTYLSLKIIKIINYYLDVLRSNKLSFVRIACHVKELDQISFFTEKVKSNRKKIMINLMQISEIKIAEIKIFAKKFKNKPRCFLFSR